MNAFQFNLVLGGVLCCSLAPAAEVTLEFRETHPGSWDVLAEIVPEAGDSVGLAGFQFEVVHVDSNLVEFTMAPLSAVDPYMFEFVGFTEPPTIETSPTTYAVGAGQAHQIDWLRVHGIGVVPVMIDGPAHFDLTTEVPAMIGNLRTPTGLSANSFSNADLTVLAPYHWGTLVASAARGSGLNVVVTPIPEPGTLAITTIALAAVVVHRRRKI